jgi:hypothetical protein
VILNTEAVPLNTKHLLILPSIDMDDVTRERVPVAR